MKTRRLIVFSDAHADWTTLGEDRFEDVRRGFQEVAQAAVDKKATDVLFLGDLMDPDCGVRAFKCIALAIQFALRMGGLGIRTHWLAGNHDVIEDGTGATTLGPLRSLYHDGPFPGQTGVYESPSWEEADGIAIGALPFTASCIGYNPCDLFRSPWIQDQPQAPAIIISHLHLPGIHPGSETTDMPRGRELMFPLEEAHEWAEQREGPVLFLQGHYHQHQEYQGVQVVGSLCSLTFGEENNQPGYLVVEL